MALASSPSSCRRGPRASRAGRGLRRHHVSARPASGQGVRSPPRTVRQDGLRCGLVAVDLTGVPTAPLTQKGPPERKAARPPEGSVTGQRGDGRAATGSVSRGCPWVVRVTRTPRGGYSRSARLPTADKRLPWGRGQVGRAGAAFTTAPCVQKGPPGAECLWSLSCHPVPNSSFIGLCGPSGTFSVSRGRWRDSQEDGLCRAPGALPRTLPAPPPGRFAARVSTAGSGAGRPASGGATFQQVLLSEQACEPHQGCILSREA